MSEKKCAICPRSALQNGVYCKYHSVSLQTLKSRYVEWENAFDGMSWERYLERVISLDETGDWSKQVAKNELDVVRNRTKA